MSEKKLEECSLEEATHVEVGGKVHKIEMDGVAQIVFDTEENTSFFRRKIGIVLRIRDGHWHTIFMDCFPIFGIKPLKEKKREPIEFEAVFFKHDGKWRTLYLGDNHLPYENSKKARFRCVEILEEEE
jgi:hypothetical protein